MSNFHDEFEHALKNGASHLELRELVLRHKAAGLSQRAAYDALEKIWLGMGCNQENGDESPSCELLGGIMDQVWGYCSAAKTIWETSLSD